MMGTRTGNYQCKQHGHEVSNLKKPIPDGLTAFDQFYAGQIKSFYAEIEALADSVWPGMILCPICIYRQDGPALLFKHPNPPESFTLLSDGIWLGKQADLQLAAATPFDINGVLTAINFYDRKDYTTECFFAELFHEMHHVYQLNHMPTQRCDDPAQVITYPELVENDALKIYENRILAQLVMSDDQHKFQELLNIFYTCRRQRQSIIGDEYFNFEKRVESMEGPAVFCQYKYLETRDKTAWDKTLFQVARPQEFFWLLCQPEFGRYHLRHRLLMTGLVQCLILFRHGIPNWQKEYFNSDMLLNDFFFSKMSTNQVPLPENKELIAAAQYFLNQTKEKRRQNLINFDLQKGLKIKVQFKTMPECHSIDPMNVETMDAHSVIHHTALKLGHDGNSLFFMTGGMLTSIIGNMFEISCLTFYIEDRNQIKYENGLVILDSEGKQLHWRGRIVSESKKELSLELE